MKIFYVDGAFVPSDQAMIPVDDLAVLRGYGVCDIMRTYKGSPYFLDEHILRLENSALKVGLTLPWTHKEIKQIVVQTLQQNQDLDEANIRMVITGGSSLDFFTPTGSPRLIVMVTAIPRLPDSWYTQGVKVITLFQEREVPEAKVISYISAAIALKDAKSRGAVEVLYVNRNKEALEGTTSNLFAFYGNTLVTPDQGVLKGITRKLVLSLASRFFMIEEKSIPLETLVQADEVFITGTNKGVVPVVHIDETRIGTGQPGTNTLKLIQALDRHSLEFMDNLDKGPDKTPNKK